MYMISKDLSSFPKKTCGFAAKLICFKNYEFHLNDKFANDKKKERRHFWKTRKPDDPFSNLFDESPNGVSKHAIQ